MSANPTLSEASVDELLDELRRRPHVVPSVWTLADAAGPVDEDEELDHLSDEQRDAAAAKLLERSGRRLEDALGQRGNEYLADRWSELRDEILAEVAAAPAP